MKANLIKYLQDHLAGAAFAIDLLERLSRKHADDGFVSSIHPLLREIVADREELSRLVTRLGGGQGGFKRTVAKLLEKLSRPKLVGADGDTFGSFQAFETLALGILGKKALWDALSQMGDLPIVAVDFARLRQRADEQHELVEKLRLDLAAVALRNQE